MKKDVISSVIWKEGFESNGLAGQIGLIFNESPVDSRESIKLSIALASASKSSADQVFELLNNKEAFPEPIEEVPGHNIELKGGNNVINLASRHKGALTLNGCLPGKGHFFSDIL